MLLCFPLDRPQDSGIVGLAPNSGHCLDIQINMCNLVPIAWIRLYWKTSRSKRIFPVKLAVIILHKAVSSQKFMQAVFTLLAVFLDRFGILNEVVAAELEQFVLWNDVQQQRLQEGGSRQGLRTGRVPSGSF